jgi:c-di-GMP-related signal transduction protein
MSVDESTTEDSPVDYVNFLNDDIKFQESLQEIGTLVEKQEDYSYTILEYLKKWLNGKPPSPEQEKAFIRDSALYMREKIYEDSEFELRDEKKGMNRRQRRQNAYG